MQDKITFYTWPCYAASCTNNFQPLPVCVGALVFRKESLLLVEQLASGKTLAVLLNCISVFCVANAT